MGPQQSAPLGNGNLAANVWVDADGAIRAYLARSDAWEAHAQLMKVGAVRIGAGLNVSAATFTHDPANARIEISDGVLSVELTADMEFEILRVGVHSDTVRPVVTAQIVPLRTNAVAGMAIDKYFGDGPCNATKGVVPDVVASAATLPGVLAGRGVALWHRNPSFDEYSILLDTLQQQGVPLDNATARRVDMLGDRVTGLALLGTNSSVVNDTVIRASGGFDVYVDVGTISSQIPVPAGGAPVDPAAGALAGHMAQGSCCTGAGVANCAADFTKTAARWAELWGASYVTVSPGSSEGAAASGLAQTAGNITSRYVWQRFLSIAGGHRARTPLKFNGMLWTVPTSKGSQSPDYRNWGGAFWSQNSRQAVHEALASADDGVVLSFFNMYERAVPVAKAREKAYWPESTSGYFFPETMMMSGLYDQGGLGWGCGWRSPNGSAWPVPSNPYIRYYYSGSLEYAMLLLDAADTANNTGTLQSLAIPMADAVTAHYFNAYGPAGTGTPIDMFPAQTMETWQCRTLPATRSDCTTDPVTAIAGLTTVLRRLLALPADLVPAQKRPEWQARLASLPPLPNGTDKSGAAVFRPGRLTASRSRNSENVATQTVFPYRITTAAKAAALGPSSEAARLLPVAAATYADRPFPCNDGWCWDVIVAAQLNETAAATAQLSQRATASPAFGGGWPGFAGHYQDYEPSLDEFAWLRTALHAMLLQPVDDAQGRMVLFPSFDAVSFDAEFKLRGPRATFVTARCSAGNVASLSVDPPARAADVLVAGCGGGMRSAAEIIATLE